MTCAAASDCFCNDASAAAPVDSNTVAAAITPATNIANFRMIAPLKTRCPILTPVEHPKFLSDTMEYRRQIYGEDLEGALVSDRNPKYLVETLSKAGIDFPKIYMACGSEDFLLERNLDFRALLLEHGVPHVYEQGPGGHEWDFWDTYIKKALDWLPLEEAAAGRSSGNVALD